VEEAVTDEKDTSGEKVSFPMCSGRIQIPTDEEQAILKEMRAVKARVRDLKERISGLEVRKDEHRQAEKAALGEELDAMRAEWKRLDSLREAAAKRRMVALGHETGGE
jgi:uncharacterized protein YPO0396